jgi:hypothetical protein
LLAAGRDSIWVLSRGAAVAVPVRDVQKASIQRHSWPPKKGLLAGAIVGVVSGIGMAAACSTESEGCGGVLVGFTLMGVIWGGVAAASLSSSWQWRFEPPVADSLRKFARFPQGLPPDALRRVQRAPFDSTRAPP